MTSVDRAEQFDAEAVRPLAVRLAVRAVDFSVSVSHDEFVADGVLDKLGIVIGMPLIEEIIDKTDFFHFTVRTFPFSSVYVGFQIIDGSFDVRVRVGAALALDGQEAGIADVLQRVEVLIKRNVAVAEAAVP